MDKKVRLHMSFDITASESFIKDLEEDLKYACIRNCFINRFKYLYLINYNNLVVRFL